VNYLMPLRQNVTAVKSRKYSKETTKMRMTGLGSKIAAFSDDLGRLAATVAEKKKEKTIRQVVEERANDRSRWHGEDGLDAPASTLRTTPPGKDKSNKHRFETMVDMIARRDGVPKSVAASRAREEFPDLFDDYQNSVGVSKSYSDLVAAEIRKGCSPVVAAQRVATLYPAAARENIVKSAASPSVAEFMARVDEIKKDRGLSRTAAMSAARCEHPDLYERFENV
jgi:hypothetical protein